jgi:hypothetical protein
VIGQGWAGAKAQAIAFEFRQKPAGWRLAEVFHILLYEHLLTIGGVEVDPKVNCKVSGADVERRVVGDLNEISIPIEAERVTNEAWPGVRVTTQHCIPAASDVVSVAITRPPCRHV